MRRNVVCLFADGGYYPPAYVLARALAANPSRSYDVVIYTDIAGRPEPAGARTLVFPLKKAIPDEAHWSERITRAAYYRIFMADILPEHYERAVYLDCDITVRGDLEDLFAVDLKGHPVGAVTDCGHVKRASQARQNAWDAYLRSIKLDPALAYFNSGVLLADLESWRRLKVSQRASAYLGEVGSRLTGMDQDTLNFVFGAVAMELSPRWNFQSLYFGSGLEETLRPVVYHHLHNIKPWHDLLYPANDHSRFFASGFENSPWPNYIKTARRWRQWRRALKWRARRAFRFLPAARKRFAVEAAKNRDWANQALLTVAQKLERRAYGDIDALESARLAEATRALLAARGVDASPAGTA